MKLKLMYIVERSEKERSFTDRRRRVNYVLASYRGEDGHEYRKAFESYGEPVVPETGTNAGITAMRTQF